MEVTERERQLIGRNLKYTRFKKIYVEGMPAITPDASYIYHVVNIKEGCICFNVDILIDDEKEITMIFLEPAEIDALLTAGKFIYPRHTGQIELI